MSAALILSRLELVKPTRPGSWIARCPAHDDNSPSLSIRELDDSRMLIHCFAGCNALSVMAAIGLSVSDLFPERINHDMIKPERRPFPAMDVLRCLRFEVLIVAIAAQAMLRGERMAGDDQSRLALAVDRIQAALDVAGVPHG